MASVRVERLALRVAATVAAASPGLSVKDCRLLEAAAFRYGALCAARSTSLWLLITSPPYHILPCVVVALQTPSPPTRVESNAEAQAAVPPLLHTPIQLPSMPVRKTPSSGGSTLLQQVRHASQHGAPPGAPAQRARKPSADWSVWSDDSGHSSVVDDEEDDEEQEAQPSGAVPDADSTLHATLASAEAQLASLHLGAGPDVVGASKQSFTSDAASVATGASFRSMGSSSRPPHVLPGCAQPAALLPLSSQQAAALALALAVSATGAGSADGIAASVDPASSALASILSSNGSHGGLRPDTAATNPSIASNIAAQ